MYKASIESPRVNRDALIFYNVLINLMAAKFSYAVKNPFLDIKSKERTRS